MRQAALVLLFSAALAGAPAPADETPTPFESATKADAPPAERLFSEWHALYVDGRKVGYHTMNVQRLADGGYRFRDETFLKLRASAHDARSFKIVQADVDPDGSPRTLDSSVAVGSRAWHVAGRRRGNAFLLERTVGADTVSAEVPLEKNLTLRTWALLASFFGAAGPGGTARWLVIDESLGAVLPDPCLVHVLGPQTVPAGPGKSLSGTAIVTAVGQEIVAHLLDNRGHTLRSVWQSAPIVAEAAGFAEARRLDLPEAGPRGPAIPGLEADRYKNDRLGYSLRVPPYPFVAFVVPDADTVCVEDLTDGSSVTIRPAVNPRLATIHADAAELLQLADVVHQQWAARFDSVEAQPPRETELGGRPARLIEGTVRLGCARLHFRNVFLVGEGFAYLVTAVADRPLDEKRALTGAILASLRLAPPEGRLPVLVSGNRLRIPYYGIEMARPDERWKIPRHLDGPATTLELAREDRAAVAVLRMLPAPKDQPLADFVAERARLAAENLQIQKPQAQPTTLGGRDALELKYAGNLLAGRPAECRTIYVPLGSQVLELVLIARTGDPGAPGPKDLETIRASIRFIEPPAADPK
ncbi:MAG TPA: hypothetical protein VFH53_11085 [Phycisphaerae bacterium]|nr:hypothetical protein [Phycisphaerae bacterium]